MFMMVSKNLSAIVGTFLSVLLIANLTGCGNQAQAGANTDTVESLQYEKIKLPDDLQNPSCAEIDGNYLRFLAENDTKQFLVKQELTSGKYEIITLADYNDETSINRCAADNEYYCYETVENVSDKDGESAFDVSLDCLAYDGTRCFSMHFDKSVVPTWDENDYIESMAFSEDHSLILSTNTMLLRMDTHGIVLATLDTGADSYVVQKSGTGTLYLRDLFDNSIYEFDLGTFSIGTKLIDGSGYQTVCKGNTKKELIGINEQGAEVLSSSSEKQMIELPDKGMSGIQAILIDENDNVYILRTNQESYLNELYKVVLDEYTEPKSMTIAVSDEEAIEPNLKYLVDQYNFDHNDYKIEFVTYSDDELSMRFTTGDAPDIMLFGNENGWNKMTLDLCARKNLLIDLEPYLEKDTELSASDFVPNILEHMKQQNGLYSITYGFRIRTLFVRKDLNARENWTLEEFIDVANQLPDGVMITDETQSGFLKTIMQWCLPSFVSVEDATCNFNSTVFYDVLQLCKTAFPAEYDDNVFQAADSFMLNYAFSAADFSMLADDIEMVGDDAVFTGFPGANGGQFIYAPVLGITYDCKNKDAAWEFVRDYTTMRNTGVFASVLQANYETLLDALKTNYSENTISKVDSLVENATTVTDHYTPIPDIVAEEAKAYFADDKTAEEVADIIQNRVSIYLSEQQ